mmetsp:Transcript_10952/g.22227  ORF Transcript_10952/g.22227 Transcript_10952/m.22227 type:complete len:205 (+) Transcript_10952:572-1186(+)
MADVADNAVVLHLGHVLERDDVLVARGGDHDIDAERDGLLHGHNTETLHARLQRTDRVDLRDICDGARCLHRLCRSLANVTEAADERLLARKHDVGRAHDAVRQRVAAAVHVVELRLRHAVVDVDRREEEGALLGHRDQAVHTGGGLLGDADHVLNKLVEAHLVLGNRVLDRGEHALKLGVVGRIRVRQGAVLVMRILELLALV